MKRRLMFVLAALLCMILPCLAMADHGMRAFVGYDSTTLSGRWYPLFVEITAEGAPIEGVIETNVRVGTQEYDVLRLPVSVQEGKTQRYRLSLRPHVSQRVFDVTLTTKNGDTYRASASASQNAVEDALVIGVLGGSREFVQALDRLERRSVHGELEAIEAIALSADGFPGNTREMDAFDALIVLSGGDTALENEQKQLLDDWQSRGGILLDNELAISDASQVLSRIESLQTGAQSALREGNAYRYGESLNAAMPVGQGEGLVFAAALLVVYVLLTGVGAYGLMKRMDRSKCLWVIIPALSVAACAMLAVLGGVSGMNRPSSSSVHVTHYRENGHMETQELALLTYAGQQRRTVSAENGSQLERMEYVYFRDRAEEPDEQTRRDIITLGDTPSIELPGGADWLRRSIVVHHCAAPKGELTASASMEKEGLRVCVANHTDTPIQNAVLLTGIGYAMLGDLAPGETAQALLARTDDSPFDEDGNPILRESQMLPFSTTLYQAAVAAVDPERAQDKDFTYEQLPEQEQQRRRIQQRVLELGAHHTQQGFACVLVGETPQIACEPLFIDGEPVKRSAQKSVLIREIPLETHSGSGHFFYPQGTFKRLRASMNLSGRPVLGEMHESSYVYEEDEVLLGFQLAGVEPASISEIRLYASTAEQEQVAMAVFDWEKQSWVSVDAARLIVLDGALLRSAVNASGELVVRYAGENLADYGVYLHNITVEGDESSARITQKEGGDAHDPM